VKHVTIGRPAYRPPDPRAEPAMMGLASELTRRGVAWSGAWVIEHPDIAWAHNDILRKFAASDSERLLIIDTDIIFQPADALRLLSSEHDYIGANYARKRPGAGLASRARKGGAQIGELVEADLLATGFLSLSRRAVERLLAAAPSVYALADDDGGGLTHAVMTTGPGLDGRWHSSDEVLCRRWQSLGEIAWIDTSIRLGHAGTHVWTQENSS
jgi:hypothetical protein